MSHAEITQLANENKVVINPATEDTAQIIKDLTVVLAQLARSLLRPTYVEGSTWRLRVSAETGNIAISSGTITNITTLSGYTTTDQVWAQNRSSFAANVISNIP